MQHEVGQCVGEMLCPVLLSRLSPCVSCDVDCCHPVERVVVALGEESVVKIKQAHGRDPAHGDIVESACRHGEIPAFLAPRSVVGRQGAGGLAVSSRRGDRERGAAQAVVVLHSLNGIRPVSVEHRHGPDVVLGWSLSQNRAWRHRKHRYQRYVYFIYTHGFL